MIFFRPSILANTVLMFKMVKQTEELGYFLSLRPT
jgi:hypothetical protein